MPHRDKAPLGAPCWIDLFTSDPDAAHGVLRPAVRLDVRDRRPGVRRLHHVRQGRPVVAGGMHNDGSQGSPDMWTVYFASADAQQTVDAAAAAGGQVYLAPMEVPAMGTMACSPIPGRRRSGCGSRPDTRASPCSGEPGTPNWFELHTSAYDASVAFYRNVFDWDTHVMGDIAGVPLHDARRGRRRPGRDHGRHVVPARRRARAVDHLLRRRGRRRRRSPRSPSWAAPSSTPPRTRPTAAWPRRPTPPAPASGSSARTLA